MPADRISRSFRCPLTAAEAYAALEERLPAAEWQELCRLFAQQRPPSPATAVSPEPGEGRIDPFSEGALATAARSIELAIRGAVASGDLPPGDYQVSWEFHEDAVLISDLAIASPHCRQPLVREQLRQLVSPYQVEREMPAPGGSRRVSNFHLSLETLSA